jgi:hypothetical protein
LAQSAALCHEQQHGVSSAGLIAEAGEADRNVPVDAVRRTDPSSYYWDGMKRIGRNDQPLVFFQFTFAWIDIYRPYLVRRISKQVSVAGPLVRATPSNPLITRFMRLVQGAFRKSQVACSRA